MKKECENNQPDQLCYVLFWITCNTRNINRSSKNLSTLSEAKSRQIW